MDVLEIEKCVPASLMGKEVSKSSMDCFRQRLEAFGDRPSEEDLQQDALDMWDDWWEETVRTTVQSI